MLTSVGSIGNTWICDGRKFYYKDGKFGVGTSDPSTVFHVSGPDKGQVTFESTDDGSLGHILRLWSNSATPSN